MLDTAAVALGSNLPASFGLPKDNLQEAVERIRLLGRVLAVSRFQETEPVGFADQPSFLNGALLLETALEPLPLLRELLVIERAMGRTRVGVPPKGPRVIDLDLIWMGRRTIQTAELTLPHPAMQERAFVLEPLADISPDWVHPVLGLSVRRLLERLSSAS